MRKDIDKVIVERPRYGSGTEESGDKGHYRKLKGKYADADDYTELESLPTHEAMNRYNKTKNLNENLAPLKRFLEGSVGRPWDKVFSELSERIDLSSTVKRHIWQHVWDFVIKDTFIGEDGKVWGVSSNYSQKQMPIEDIGYFEALYVHPTDGLLKKIKRPKNWQPVWKRLYNSPYNEPRKDYEQILDVGDFQYRKKKGIWYVIELRKIPEKLSQKIPFGEKDELDVSTKDGSIVDACLGASLFDMFDPKTGAEKQHWHSVKVDGEKLPDWHHNSLSSYYGRKGVYGAKYKQANSKELKAAGLKNDPPKEEEDGRK